MKPIAAVIPHYRNPIALEKTKEFLSKQTLLTDVFVRDNSDDNVLFTRAVNEGLRKFCFTGDHDFVVVLNHDAYLAPDCIERMLKVMSDNPKCGIVTPVAIDMAGQVTWAGGLQAYPWGRHFSVPLKDLTEATMVTPWANGACMLLRISMVHEIGLLDENMQFVCSDSDYSFTARSRGWSVQVATQALMVHQPQTSSGQHNSQWISEIMLQDQLYFAEKWLTGDVYKRLALEGPDLNAEYVSLLVEKTKSEIDRVRSGL